MPRHARKKSPECVYHVMVRSVGGAMLFNSDTDKDKYLDLIKKYQDIFMFKVYAYCIMDNHAHFIIDSAGADITKFMHVINQCYAQNYYNKVYKRTGHLFADRFKSKIIDNDRYLLTASGYIHNNPSDIEGFRDRVYEYRYSSLGIYLGIMKDERELVSAPFIMSQFSSNSNQARVLYLKFVTKCISPDVKLEMEFANEKSEYRDERRIIARNYTPWQIAEFVSKYTGQSIGNINIKGSKTSREFRSIVILMMKCMCNYTHKQICAAADNISMSQVSKLMYQGASLIRNDPKYQRIMIEFLNECRCACV